MLDNVIPDFAVPFSEAYGGPQFIARAFLEARLCLFLWNVNLMSTLLGWVERRVTVVRIYTLVIFVHTQLRQASARRVPGCRAVPLLPMRVDS